jgi:hypothetical protein
MAQRRTLVFVFVAALAIAAASSGEARDLVRSIGSR